MTSTSAQSSSIKNEMKVLACPIFIPVLRPRIQRPPFGLEAEDGPSDIWRVFLWGWLSAFLCTYVRSLAFALTKVAFCCIHSWADYLCSKNWNAISQQSLDAALLRDMAGTVLLKTRCSNYITPFITSSPGTHNPVSWWTFQQKWLLAVLRNFPQKRLFSCCCL